MSRIVKLLLLAGLAAIAVSGARAQTPPQGMNLTTGMPYACENAFGYVGCEQLMHPGARPPPPAPLPDVWAAIAVSPSNLAWGVKWLADSKRQAEADALAVCAKRAKDCRIVNATADICLALVQSIGDKVSVVGGPSGAANFAADNGMLKCQRAGGRGCKVLTSFCADGVKHEVHGHTEWSNGNPIFVPDGATGAAFGRR